MGHAFCDALYQQCLQRARVLAAAAGREVPPHAIVYFARRAAQVARRNSDRIPSSPPPHHRTSYPDSYIDAILWTIVREEPRIDALLREDNVAWEEMLHFMHRRVRHVLRRYYAFLPIKIPFDALSRDVTHHCACLLWRKLPDFPYDTSLNAWVAVLVTNEISTLRRRADFRWNNFARSLEKPLTLDPNGPSLGDMLPDDGIAEAWERWEKLHVIRGCMDHLTPDQQEVIRHGLRGEDTAWIARHMGRSRGAVYALRSRAVKVLRDMIAAD